MRTFGRLAALWFATIGAAACQFPYPADVPDDDATGTRALGGAVTGLWTGGAVTLRLTAGDVSEDLAADGAAPFTFVNHLLDGTSYLVSVVDDGPDHDCTVTNGSGRTGGADITDLAVACTNLIPHGVAISTAVPFTFDPRTTRYSLPVSILQQELTVVVTGATLTSARVAGQPVTLGQASAPVALGQGMTTVTVDVAKGPLSQRYELVFDRGAAPIVEALHAMGSGGGDQYGISVAADGDYVVIGAASEDGSDETGNDNAVTDSGAVYLYRRNGQTWTYLQTLKGSAISMSRGFGISVAIHGDTLVVGAGNDDARANDAGAAYVFRLDAATGRWREEQRVTASDAHAGDRFGSSVAVSGDLMVVGAPYHDHASGALGDNFGQAYSFRRTGTTWSAAAFARSGAPQRGDAFGRLVALNGAALAVQQSDPLDPNGWGPISVVRWTGAAWSTEPISPPVAGAAIAIEGDRLVIGNPDDGPGGAVRAYTRTGAAWAESAVLRAANPMVGAEIGLGVALRGNVVTTTARDGALQGFQLSGGVWVPTPPLPVTGPFEPIAFGAIALTTSGAVVGSFRTPGPANLGDAWFFR